VNPRANPSPADHTIALLGCLGGAVMLATVAVVALITGEASIWISIGPAGAAALSALAWWSWQLVRRYGFYHPVDDEDEDGSPEGGSRIRFPPDAPDDGSLAFDWDGFLTSFWEYVEAAARERVPDTVGV
jgi:hypothetical protein